MPRKRKPSKQRKWQDAHRAAGLCATCGIRRLVLYTWACDPCTAQKRARQRKRAGCKPKRAGGPGRPTNAMRVAARQAGESR